MESVPRRPVRPVRPVRRAVGLAILVVGALTLSACGEPEEASLCADYESFLAAGAEVRGIDPENSSAAEATDLVEGYLASVRQMQDSADGRYASELDALEMAVTDVLRTLDSVPDTADYRTWAPLVKDSLETAADAAVTVRARIGPTCPQGS